MQVAPQADKCHEHGLVPGIHILNVLQARTCVRVLTTSSGVVTAAARPPPTVPATKLAATIWPWGARASPCLGSSALRMGSRLLQ